MKTEKRSGKFIPLVAEQGDGCCVVCDVTHMSIDAKDTADTVKLLSALADPTRLQIVQMLAGMQEPLCVCDIQGHFDLGQPTISHHLKVLRDAGLVLWEKRGLWVYYSLNADTFRRGLSFLNRISENSEQLARAVAR